MSIVMKSSSNGTTVIYMNGEPTPSLKELQKAVGGYIEVVELTANSLLEKIIKSQMIVNEEGLIYDLPVNDVASAIAKRHIVGNVVILNGSSVLT